MARAVKVAPAVAAPVARAAKAAVPVVSVLRAAIVLRRANAAPVATSLRWNAAPAASSRSEKPPEKSGGFFLDSPFARAM